MNKKEFNKYAVALVEEEFKKYGFKIEESPLPSTQVNFNAISSDGRLFKVKVRAASQIGIYIYVKKVNFDIEDPDLYMAIPYLPYGENLKDLYLVPATEWGKDIYPFKGRDYNKPGQVSEPEWGISFSQKAKDAMEPYRFSNMI